MARTLTQRGADKAPPAKNYAAPGTAVTPANPMDSDAMKQLAEQCEHWWLEARDRHAPSRVQRFIDHDYYDHDQISAEDRAVYEERGQAPVVQNLIQGAVNWLSGTERRTRIDWTINPRGPEDEEGAKAQSHLMKFVSDSNRAGWERSRAFKDACISGVGFVEEFLRKDKSQEAVGYGYVDWRYLWWDPYSRDLDFGDARYMHRTKFVDLDRAIAMCPDRAGDLKAASVSSFDNDFVLMDRMDGVPAMYALSQNGLATSLLSSGHGLSDRAPRSRVRMIETWYPRAQVTRQIQAEIADCMDLEGITYDANNAELREKYENGFISLTDSLTHKMAMCIWVPGVGICKAQDSPYKHNMMPFTAAWCYRHHRDGMPYGVVRGIRDSQDEYNKRRAKALYAASVNRVEYESDSMDADDERDNLDEYGRMNGEVKLAPNGLNKVRVTTGLEVSRQHVDFQQQAKDHIFEGSGITKENLGQDTGALSGRAIVAKQQQGSVTTAELFDLYRYMIEVSGQKLLENIKVGIPTQRQIQIVGENEGKEWLTVNKPVYDPATNSVRFENDILNTLSDFKVGEQDFRETLRMAMAESLFEVIGKLPPEMAMQLIDLAVELTDIPNKQKFIDRVQKMNGVQPQPQDPDQAAAQQSAQDKAQQQADELHQAQLSAQSSIVEKNKAAAELHRAKAKQAVLGAKKEALDVAGIVHAAIPLAKPADDLYAGANATPPQPVPAGVVTQ